MARDLLMFCLPSPLGIFAFDAFYASSFIIKKMRLTNKSFQPQNMY